MIQNILFHLCSEPFSSEHFSSASPSWCILYLVFSFSLYTSTRRWSSRAGHHSGVSFISSFLSLSLYQNPQVVQLQSGTTVVYLISRLFFLSLYTSTHMLSICSRTPQWCILYLVFSFFLSVYQYPHVVQSQPDTTVVYLISRLFFLSLCVPVPAGGPVAARHHSGVSYISSFLSLCVPVPRCALVAAGHHSGLYYISSFLSLCIPVPTCAPVAAGHHSGVSYISSFLSLCVPVPTSGSVAAGHHSGVSYISSFLSLCVPVPTSGPVAAGHHSGVSYISSFLSLCVPVPTCAPVAARHHSGVSYISSFLSLSVYQYPQVVQSQPGTTVVVQQPMQQQPMRDWNYGLFECFDDLKICT